MSTSHSGLRHKLVCQDEVNKHDLYRLCIQKWGNLCDCYFCDTFCVCIMRLYCIEMCCIPWKIWIQQKTACLRWIISTICVIHVMRNDRQHKYIFMVSRIILARVNNIAETCSLRYRKMKYQVLFTVARGRVFQMSIQCRLYNCGRFLFTISINYHEHGYDISCISHVLAIWCWLQSFICWWAEKPLFRRLSS